MPLPAERYAKLLREKIEKHSVNCWLVNTGWTAGPYGTGYRMPIAVSREIVSKIISGELASSEYLLHEHTNLMIPANCVGDLAKYANPEKTWPSKEEYAAQAKKLMTLFREKKNDLGL